MGRPNRQHDSQGGVGYRDSRGDHRNIGAIHWAKALIRPVVREI